MSHFLLETYSDTDFVQLSKYNKFETKIGATTSKDCKLVRITDSNPIISNTET